MKITDKFIEPLPSATVLLIRDGQSGPEVFLVLRRKEASFGASYVFPGGIVDPVDKTMNGHLDDSAKDLMDKQLDVGSGGFPILVLRYVSYSRSGIYMRISKGSYEISGVQNFVINEHQVTVMGSVLERESASFVLSGFNIFCLLDNAIVFI